MNEPLALHLGPVTLYAYTAFLGMAIALGSAVYVWGVHHYRLDPDKAVLLYIGALAGAVLGGKLSMLVFLGPQVAFAHLPDLARTGMAYTGALIGGYVGVRLMERKAGMRCNCFLFALALPLMQAIGRIGNFLAVDAYGTPTTLPWGVEMAGAVRHPVQLYEAALDLALFAVLWSIRHKVRNGDDLFKCYLIGYALIRFPLEFVRHQPTPQYAFGLTLVQHVCILGFATAAASLAWSSSRHWRESRRRGVPLLRVAQDG